MRRFFFGSMAQMIAVILMSISTLAMFLLAYFAQVIDSTWIILFFVAMFFCVAYLNVDYFSRSVTISKSGVRYTSLTKKFELKWEEIRHVEVRDIPIFRNVKEFLVFSTEYLPSYELAKLASSGRFIAMENRTKRVIREVRKYWIGPIVGVEDSEYIDK